MKRTFLLILFATPLLWTSCHEDNHGGVREELRGRFHGKYEIISAVSDTPVDLNMDGFGNTYLFDENPEISKSGIELRINDELNLFTEYWPIEYISNTGQEFDSSRYDPDYSISYAHYALGDAFQFNEDLTAIELLNKTPMISNGIVDTRFVYPSAVKIESDDTITVTTQRKLYTSEGYLSVKIVARYRRYTQVT